MIRSQPKLPTETELQILRKHWLLIGLILSTFAADWSAPIVIERMFRHQLNLFDGMVVGLVVAQLFAAAHFLVLFPAQLAFRSCVAAVYALLSLLSFALGTLYFGEVSENAFAIALGMTPGVILAASVPFWIAKHVAHWRLFFLDSRFQDEGRLTIAALMIGTAAIVNLPSS